MWRTGRELGSAVVAGCSSYILRFLISIEGHDGGYSVVERGEGLPVSRRGGGFFPFWTLLVALQRDETKK